MGRSHFDVALGDDHGLRPKGVINFRVITGGHVGDVEAGHV